MTRAWVAYCALVLVLLVALPPVGWACAAIALLALIVGNRDHYHTKRVRARDLLPDDRVSVGRFRTRRVASLTREAGRDDVVAFLLCGERFYRYCPEQRQITIRRQA